MEKNNIDGKSKIPRMDTAEKPLSLKEAEASGFIHLRPETIRMIKEQELEKGEAIARAEAAGVQAAKNSGILIPLLHESSTAQVSVKAYVYPNGIEVKSLLTSVCKTGLETEALTAVCVALLTLFEICKIVDSSLVISDIKLLRRTHEEG